MDDNSDEAERLTGFVATGCGRTEVRLELFATRVVLHFFSRWMGDEQPFELVLVGRRAGIASHSGAIELESARGADNREVPLPPSDGPIVLEYARVPPQPAEVAGSEGMDAAGFWTDPWSLLLWLHPHSYYDDGTQLPAADYEHPPSEFAPVVKVLKELEHPWKLG